MLKDAIEIISEEYMNLQNPIFKGQTSLDDNLMYWILITFVMCLKWLFVIVKKQYKHYKLNLKLNLNLMVIWLNFFNGEQDNSLLEVGMTDIETGIL